MHKGNLIKVCLEEPVCGYLCIFGHRFIIASDPAWYMNNHTCVKEETLLLPDKYKNISSGILNTSWLFLKNLFLKKYEGSFFTMHITPPKQTTFHISCEVFLKALTHMEFGYWLSLHRDIKRSHFFFSMADLLCIQLVILHIDLESQTIKVLLVCKARQSWLICLSQIIDKLTNLPVISLHD